MLMSPKFKQVAAVNGVIEFNRAGVASKVVLPENLQKRISYDINVDAENNQVVFSEGESVYIMTDRFGLLGGKDEEVEANIFFIEGGLVIELITGKILLQGENDQVYMVNEIGDIEYPTPAARMTWLTAENVHSNVVPVIKHRYTLSDALAPKYVENFAFNTLFHYVNTNSGYICKSRFVEEYGDLGLEKFQFINYAEAGAADADDDHTDISELEDIDEPEEFPMDGNDDSYEGVL